MQRVGGTPDRDPADVDLELIREAVRSAERRVKAETWSCDTWSCDKMKEQLESRTY